MLVILALVQAVTLSGRVQQGVTVSPDTVRVGEPFTVSVRIRAPLGATIEFPAIPDSGDAVEPLDPVLVETAADSVMIDQTASYRLAAWQVGSFEAGFADVLVRQDIGIRRIPITGAGIVVLSVLPADSALHVPKPPRDVFTFGLPWWVWAALGAAILVVFALATWLWRRRRGRPQVADPPITIAEGEFDRVESLGLVAAGERARHVDLMVEALRDYLATAVPGASNAETSRELVTLLRNTRLAPHARCAALLAEVDLVKFAGQSLTADRAIALGREARAVATAVDGSPGRSGEAEAA